MIFSMDGPVWRTLRRATQALDEAGIPYVVIGGLAVFLHGHRRMTTDVDLVVSSVDRATVKDALQAFGLMLRKGEFIGPEDVRVHLAFDDMPAGADWAKSIRFPDPRLAVERSRIKGFATVRLARLIEIKLACGLTNPRRPQDIADVLRLIDVNRLDKRFAGKLHPLLRKEYKRLIDITRRYPASIEGYKT